MLASNYIKTLLLVALMLVLTVPPHVGFMVLLFLPIFIAWAIYGSTVMIRKPEQRKLRAIKIAIWTTAFLVVGAIHLYWARAARKDADAVLSAVHSYKTKTGMYPENVTQLGIDERDLQHKWMLGYLPGKDQPFLAYASTFMLFGTFTYDFHHGKWKYNSD